MDSYTLSLVVFIFAVSLVLYFVTTACVVPVVPINPPPPPPLPEKCVAKVLDIKIPPVLRQNVAVGRLLRQEAR